MKKIMLACLLAFLLTGCSVSQVLSENDFPAALTPSTQPTPAPSPLVAQSQDTLLWARSQLPSSVQETYDRLAAAAAAHQDTAVDLNATAEEVSRALTAITVDHPELFWFGGEASYVTTTMPLLGEQVSCTLNYTMTTAQVQETMAAVENYVTEVCADPNVANAQSDYEKILGVYRYIIQHTDYVLSEADQSFLTVMTRGQGTCAGYARCFQYLMHRLGIPCTLALGYGDTGESHGWNLVMCGDAWYHIDVTWGDPVDNNGNPGDALEYTYCMLTDGEIYRTHTLEPGFVVPECTAAEFNYYRQSGLQMHVWDMGQYEALMTQASAWGQHQLTVRFDRQEDYVLASEALITNSGIMEVFWNCGITVPPEGVTYSYNDDFYEFSVKIPG